MVGIQGRNSVYREPVRYFFKIDHDEEIDFWVHGKTKPRDVDRSILVNICAKL